MGAENSQEVNRERVRADDATRRYLEEEQLRRTAEEELLKVREQEAARLRAEEEELNADRKWLEDLRTKRTKLLNGFHSQKYLMIGSPGVGKSSLINSFNFVVNLCFNEAVDYVEVAEVGGGQLVASSKTQLFEEYSAELDEAMYADMTDEQMRAKAPSFFDVAGIPNQSKYSKLIQVMAQGKVEDETAINPLLGEDPVKLNDKLTRSSKELTSWGILFVVPLIDVTKEDVPEELARGLAEATIELAKLKCEIPIFIIITKIDLLPRGDADEKLKPFIELLKNAINIEENRIFGITNFTPSDRRTDYTMQPIKSKQIEILDAFNQILKYKPKFMRKNKRPRWAIDSPSPGSFR